MNNFWLSQLITDQKWRLFSKWNLLIHTPVYPSHYRNTLILQDCKINMFHSYPPNVSVQNKVVLVVFIIEISTKYYISIF